MSEEKSVILPEYKALEEIHEILCETFKDEKHKILLWLSIPNPMLGKVAPFEMIKGGRATKLLKVMLNMRDGNLP